MPDIDTRKVLQGLLDECLACRVHFFGNAPTIVLDDESALTEEQIVAVAVHLNDLHNAKHVD